jgi:hypothetical protein
MSTTTVKTPRNREAKVLVPEPAATAAPAEPAVPVYAPDRWALCFWLGCAGVLILLHVIDWVSALLSRVLQ